MKKIFPSKLQRGDTVRIISPSRSIQILSEETKHTANKRFEEMGLTLTFGNHVNECDDFSSSSIESRIEDLHQAFLDKEVKAIITVIGGFNCNQLLKYIDWELVRNNPKIFCGFSDITALNNAIYTKTGLVTYSGPHYTNLGQKLSVDYTLEYFSKCLFSDDPFDIVSSNDGLQVIHDGEAEGTIIGANVCTLNLLQGTEYMPSLENSILYIEDDYESLDTHPVPCTS